MYAFLSAVSAFVSDRFEKKNDRGATAVEYGLLVGLIAVVIIVAVVALGGQLNTLVTSIVTSLGGTVAAPAEESRSSETWRPAGAGRHVFSLSDDARGGDVTPCF